MTTKKKLEKILDGIEKDVSKKAKYERPITLKTKCWSVEEVQAQNRLYLFEELRKAYQAHYME